MGRSAPRWPSREDYNCRCWAEGKDCVGLWLELREIVEELIPLDSRLSELERLIQNTEGEIEELKTRIEFFSHWRSSRPVAETIAQGSSALAIVAQSFIALTDAKIEDEIRIMKNKLRVKQAYLASLKMKWKDVEKTVYILKFLEKKAIQAYRACTGRTG